jgi:ribonuclease HIII
MVGDHFAMHISDLDGEGQEPACKHKEDEFVARGHANSVPPNNGSGILCCPVAERCIGVDESGKGDYFGPLVVAACYVGPEHLAELEDVRESKKVTDAQCLRLAGKIRAVCPHKMVVLPPEKYNKLHNKMRNLNRLLAWAHARAIEDLLEQHPQIIEGPETLKALSDQFAKPGAVEDRLFERGRSLRFESRVRAESEPCVAAASLLARATFLYKLKDLSDEWGVPLPKGAGPEVIRAGKAFVAKHGAQHLQQVAKVHFKTTDSILQSA